MDMLALVLHLSHCVFQAFYLNIFYLADLFSR